MLHRDAIDLVLPFCDASIIIIYRPLCDTRTGIGGRTVKVGYARVSTLDQVAGFEAQLAELKGLGCERIFQEQISSVAPRAQLELALDYLRDVDVLHVTKLDRLARSSRDLLTILDRIKRKGAHLVVGNLGSLDPESPTGALLLTILGAIAAFEREFMIERQREGISAAKAAGRYKGRKPTARAKAEDVIKLAAEGVDKTEIARRLGMHRASVYRILGATAPAF
jgi:DNA invertase Pin-like site-specific DNA recombinase